MSTIGDRIKERREELGWSQVELAQRAGVSAGTIGNLEAGLRLRPRGIVGLAATLGVHAHWLETGTGPRLIDDKPSARPAPPAGSVSLLEALAAMERHLLLLPPQERDAVASALQGWASSGGAQHWRRLVVASFEAPAAPSGKQRAAGKT